MDESWKFGRGSQIRIRALTRCGITCLSGAVVLLVASAGFAQQIVSASPDVTLGLSGSVVAADHDVAVDNQLGIVALENLGALPAGSDVVAYSLVLSGDRLIAFGTTTLLPGGLAARRGDIIRFDGTNWSLEVDACALDPA